MQRALTCRFRLTRRFRFGGGCGLTPDVTVKLLAFWRFCIGGGGPLLLLIDWSLC